MVAILKKLFLVLGFLLVAAVIWLFGPYFSFLESATARLALIAAIVLLWIGVRLFKRWQAARASNQLLDAVVAQKQPAEQLPADAAKLRERFEEAVTALKQQHKSGNLYELPWYVIIGAPGSGKTTALVNSGLDFTLGDKGGKAALRGVGGTRNCDWWFTEEAIFLDTAGRYTTQDSDPTSDSVGWTEFLSLLRKYRARRPINGVILTINAPDLITQGGAAHVDAARRRLEELTRELGVQIPVYVMVTKCDLVAGFTEFFDDLTPEARAQVWGVTFPYEQTISNEAPDTFPGQFDALIARLNERVFERVEQAHEPKRRTKVFAFPQQVASMREALVGFVRDVFGARKFDEQILLRGVYFTSGTQAGTPIDRLLGSISRRFGSAESVAAPSGPGKAYFVERLLKDVLIGESGLAGVNRQLEARKAAMQLGAYAATGIVAASGVALLSYSYNRNRNYLDQTAGEIARFERVPAVPPAAPIDRIVPRLDSIRAIVDSSDAYRDDTSWAMRWGLYQGASVGNSARDAYRRELDGLLLQRVAAMLRGRVAESMSQPERLFVYLKGYLMLGQPEHLDAKHLQLLAENEWNRPGAPLGTGESLSKHFRALLENSGNLRPMSLDAQLVARAQGILKQASMAKIVYEALKDDYPDNGQGELRFAELAGAGVDQVLRRKSGAPLAMRRLFSKEAFKEIAVKGQADLLKDLAADGWVLGEGYASLTSAGSLVSEFTNLYEQEYTQAWDDFLNDLEFVKFPTIPQTADELRLLSAPVSPLRELLRVVRDNTTLVEAQGPTTPTGVGIIDQARSITERLNNRLRAVQQVAGLPTTAPGTGVTSHFGWVRQLLTGDAGQQPLDSILTSIAAIHQQLATLGPDVAASTAIAVLSNPSFRTLLQNYSLQAAALPVGLRPLMEEIPDMVAGRVGREGQVELDELYDRDVLTACRSYIQGRYPFQSDSGQDISLADFATVFGYDGIFDRFFTQQLGKFVDTTTTTWSWRAGAPASRRRLLEQFQAAQRIRDMFFQPGAKEPVVDFNLVMTDLDRTATRFVLQLDGQMFDEKHLPPVRKAAKWPGQKSEARFTFEERFWEDGKPYGGSWAWFRLIDETSDPQPDPQQRVHLTLRSANHSIRVMVEAASATRNPFYSRTWRQFSCEP